MTNLQLKKQLDRIIKKLNCVLTADSKSKDLLYECVILLAMMRDLNEIRKETTNEETLKEE